MFIMKVSKQFPFILASVGSEHQGNLFCAWAKNSYEKYMKSHLKNEQRNGFYHMRRRKQNMIEVVVRFIFFCTRNCNEKVMKEKHTLKFFWSAVFARL
jgi:hypothetical protein